MYFKNIIFAAYSQFCYNYGKSKHRGPSCNGKNSLRTRIKHQSSMKGISPTVVPSQNHYKRTFQNHYKITSTKRKEKNKSKQASEREGKRRYPVKDKIAGIFPSKLLHPLDSNSRRIIQIINHDGLVATQEQLQHRVAPDIPRSACHQYALRHLRHQSRKTQSQF